VHIVIYIVFKEYRPITDFYNKRWNILLKFMKYEVKFAYCIGVIAIFIQYIIIWYVHLH